MEKIEGISIRKEIDQFGDVYYYNEQNQLHREDGPAVECANGDKYWYQNDKRHRVDGPAIEYTNGDKYWYYNNELLGYSWRGYSQQQFEQWKKFKAFT